MLPECIKNVKKFYERKQSRFFVSFVTFEEHSSKRINNEEEKNFDLLQTFVVAEINFSTSLNN